MTEAQCHALHVRATPVDTAALAARLATVHDGRLWVEDLPVPSASPAAERRRSLELGRPTGTVRGVLLRWSDGAADLLLVARRDVLDRTALLRLSEGADPGHPVGAPPAAVPVTAFPPPPPWGLGEEGSVRPKNFLTGLTDGDAGDERSWLTALAVTLHRYAPEHAPVIGTLRGAMTASPDGPLSSVEMVPTDQSAAAGLLFDGTRGAGTYVPCLAPPFPLTLSVFEDGGGRHLRCDHLPGHITPEMARQFVRHLIEVHRQVLSTPGRAVTETELLDEAERARIVALGRPSADVISTPTTLHAAFRRIAAAVPDAEAVSAGTVRLTYRELDERSDRLAAGLRACGVRDGDRVGVCLERTAGLIVTLLGVLKAGAAYVPTDPAYPAERLAYTVQDARVRVVVTELTQFPGGAGAEPVSPRELIAAGEGGAPRSAVDANDPAYIIYTSGSTGRPKGVVVPHRNPVALIDATREEYALGPADVWTFFHSSAFDFSVWEIWGALLTGGRVVVVPHDVSREPDRFRDLLRAERVTVLSQTPSAFGQLLHEKHADLAVRLVVFGGEPLDARMLLPWFDQHPESGCRVVNMFGITETTVHATAQTLTRGLALAGTRSVGTALPGWQVYVADRDGRLLPPGVAGEIRVGGAGVALGYLGQEELTSRRFIPDPYTGGRLYLSGDCGRLRPDGRLDHLGRLDSQVKVRGFRIELEEIRSVLLEDPEVRAAAVVVRHDDPADAATARIDAYVVLTGAGPSDPSEIRRRVAATLPAYMVPSTVTPLPVLPLTTNGKLDPTRLPDPVLARATQPNDPPTADHDLTARLSAVWGKVLGVHVGPDDDFFELGGNSLFAIRIGTAMRAEGLPPVRLRDLYRHPTVRALLTSLTAEGTG
ncbi:amino acid adenylation domain-containing protein [Streptomyces sp. NPDC056638]|uniref:non-ribosomal peptide synthetase n=1 Tax=Streptomyces sp. NPDC056638 TaxID=3345887 RepID=UPI0036D17D14